MTAHAKALVDPRLVPEFAVFAAAGPLRNTLRVFTLVALLPFAGQTALAADLDGDGNDDVLLRHLHSDSWRYYTLADGVPAEHELPLETEPVWRYIAAGDFDGNGFDDILVHRDDTLESAYHAVTEDGVEIQPIRFTVNPLYGVLGAGDLDGDGADEILIRGDDGFGAWLYYDVDGARVTLRGNFGPTQNVDFEFAALGDLDGDGRDDILARHRTQGHWIAYLMEGTERAALRRPRITQDLLFRLQGLADITGDGKADPILRNVTTGQWIYYATGNRVGAGQPIAMRLQRGLGMPLDSGWQFAALGDYDGDGRATPLLRDPLARDWRLYNIDGNTSEEVRLPSLETGPAWASVETLPQDNRTPLEVSGDVRLRDPATGRTALHIAARANAPNLIVALVAAGAEVDARDKDGHSPLHEAATGNAADAIAALLAAGADLHAENHLSQTPLQHAASLASSGSVFRGRDRVYAFVPDAIAALLDAGAEPNVANATLFGATPLSWVSRGASREDTPEGLATLTLLLDAGANPNVENHTFGTTPLQLSVDGASTQAAEALLSAGAEPNTGNFEGRTALQRWASWGVSQAMLRVLTAAGADTGVRDESGATLLHLAAERDNTLTLRAMLDADVIRIDERDDAGRTALHAAASTTSIRRGSQRAGGAFAMLLEAGADPHMRDDVGDTPVQSAPQADQAMLASLVEAHSGGPVAKPNQRDALGNTALHAAARADALNLVDALLTAGASPDVRNNDGHTPVQLAVGERPTSGTNLPKRTYSPKVVSALLSASEAPTETLLAALDFASAYIRRNEGFAHELGVVAALAQAAVDMNLVGPSRRGFLAMLALAASNPAAIPTAVVGGADPNVHDHRGEPLLYWIVGFQERAAVAAVKAVAQLGSVVDYEARSAGTDQTPLERAAHLGRPSVVAALLAAGASPTASSLHRAAQRTRGGVVMIETLLAAGVDVGARGGWGRTPLHSAVEAGIVPNIAALVRAGANLEAENSRGLTPLQVAAKQDERFRAVSVTVAALVEAGADVEVVRTDGKTLLHAAVLEGRQALSYFLRSLGTPWTGPGEAPPTAANFQLVGVEFFQGPMVASWNRDGITSSRTPEYAVAEQMHARSVLGRASTLAVRVTSASPDPLAEVSVSLEDAVGGSSMHSYIRGAPAVVDVPETANSGLWEAEYVFALPAAWAEPGGQAIIRVDPHDGVREIDEDDNSAVLTMDGQNVPAFDVTLVPVVFDGSRPEVNADRYAAVLNDLLPVADYRARVGRPLDLSGRGLGVADVESSKRIALEELLHRWNAEAEAEEHYHGLLFADGITLGFGGLGERPGNVSVGDAFDERCRPESRTCGTTVAHELGHNFGLVHAPGGCDEPGPIDSEFPYAGAGIGPRRGWIASRGQFVAPSSADDRTYARHYDVMSYCLPQFVSDYNYNKAVSYRESEMTAQGPGGDGVLPTLEFRPVGPGGGTPVGSGTRLDPVRPPEQVSRYPSPSVAQSRAEAKTSRDRAMPSVAFSGALDEYGQWSVARIHASALSPRQPPAESTLFFTLQDANQREIYRERMELHSLTHGTTLRTWAVRVPMSQNVPVYVAILDADGMPLFVEPFDLPDLEKVSDLEEGSDAR